MQQNPKFSVAELTKLLSTPEGRQLQRMVQQADPALLQQAMEAAKAGDTDKAKELLRPLSNSLEAEKFINRYKGG